MENNSRKAAIAYVANVLGASSFLIPEGTVAEPFAPVDQAVDALEAEQPVATPVPGFEGDFNARLAFVANSEALDLQGRDLFERMVKAMKLSPENVLLIPLDLGHGSDVVKALDQVPRAAVIVYGLESAERLLPDEKWVLARWVEPTQNVPLLTTHSLQDILARPELKKIAWQHLQLAMQRLV